MATFLRAQTNVYQEWQSFKLAGSSTTCDTSRCLKGTVAARSKACFRRARTEIMGSNPTRGMDICVLCSCCPVLDRADPPSKDSYQLSTRFTLSELILNLEQAEDPYQSKKYLK
jgi:hypothetical protein